MRNSVSIQSIKRSTATIENTPNIALNKRIGSGPNGSFFNLLRNIFEGILKDQIHFIVN